MKKAVASRALERVGGEAGACCLLGTFFDAAKLNPDDRVAAQMITDIDELFAIDAEGRTEEARNRHRRPAVD